MADNTPLIVVTDDGTHHEMVLQPPAGISEIAAHQLIGAALDTARKADPEEWNYGDVEKILVDTGFTSFKFTVCEFHGQN